MGVSTDGQICYGFILKEEQTFPWDNEKFDYDVETWWVEGILGFKHSFELFDENGRWIEPRQSKEVEDRYFQEKRDFEESHEKFPYELVNYCSGDYPMYILAIKRTCMSASRGYPEKFDPQQMEMISQEEDADFMDFCKKYKIKTKGTSQWYLSSYWG
jgi:hypothetical protein